MDISNGNWESRSEFSERMIERIRKRQLLLSTVIPTKILEPLEISSPSSPSEISELSSPSELSELSAASELSEPLLPSASSAIRELSVPSASSPLTDPSVPSMPSTLTESSEPSLPQFSSSEYYDNNVEATINHNRKLRLAKLANRIDTWLLDDNSNAYHAERAKQKNISNLNVNLEETMETNTSTTEDETHFPILPSFHPSIKEHYETKIFESKSPQHYRSGPQYMDDYQSIVYATPSVADRRAIFEQFIAQPQNTKSISTTTVTVTLTKTTPMNSLTSKPAVAKKSASIVNSPNDASITTVADKSSAGFVNSLPDASITKVVDKSSAAGIVNCPPDASITTTANKSSAIANNEIGIDKMPSLPQSFFYSQPPMGLHSNFECVSTIKTLPKLRDTWTPPCIKNVLLKTQLDDDPNKLCSGSGGVLATSSPWDTSAESPADKIAKSVGHVQFMSPSPTSGLYPRIEVVENNTKATIPTSDNQLVSSKRRNDGSSTMNSSIRSSESVSGDSDEDNIVVKRSRCEPKVVDTDMTVNEIEAIDTESSTAVTPGTSSLLSDHDGTFSQISNSFTFYQPSNNEPSHDADLKKLACHDFVDSEESQDSKKVRETNKIPCTQVFTPSPPLLVRTISTYRKQQQLRQASNKIQTAEYSTKRDKPLNNFIDDEEEVRALDIAAKRVQTLDKTVKDQNRIIMQTTHALNMSEFYRQRNSQSRQSSEYSNEHLYAERLLLIANLKRTDAIHEAQRLRHEHILSPTGIAGGFRFRPSGFGKRVIIDSLRIPLLTAVTTSNGSVNKVDYRSENLTKWPPEMRYFVCVIRATATVYRPPMTTATRPVDALNESIYRFTLENPTPYNEIGFGYVDFILRNKKEGSAGHMFSEKEGGPIVIDGLDNSAWKITVELYGLYSSPVIGEFGNSSGNNKDSHEKSVLDKIWSSVTPNKESKKPNSSKGPIIESPSSSSAVRTSMFRQLGYFVFSEREVHRQHFTLNKVHQSRSSTSTSTAIPPTNEPEIVRCSIHLLKNGEQYVNRRLVRGRYVSIASFEENLVIKPLILPPACKLTEGFITLFDDFALRPPFEFEENEIPKWQHFINEKANFGSRAIWTRLWFRLQIINDPNAQKDDDEDINDGKKKKIIHPQTVVLYYWLQPEYAEQNRKPGGIIDLSGCLPLIEGIGMSKPLKVEILPAAQPFTDSSVRPNTVRLLFTGGYTVKDAFIYPDDYEVNEPLLLAFDSPEERTEWCNTINGAVNALDAHREQFIKCHEYRRKQKELKNK